MPIGFGGSWAKQLSKPLEGTQYADCRWPIKELPTV
jgi:hypothetical protein